MSIAKQIPGEEVTHYQSPRQKRVRPKPKMQPPMTPMIDCTFQLLLFFLITATFRDEGNIPGSIPDQGAPSPDQTVKPTFVYVFIRQVGEGPVSRPDYAVKQVGAEVGIEVPKGLDVEEYRREAAEALYVELAKRRGNDDKMVAIIQPEISEDGRYVRWQYVAEAYNQVVRAGYKKQAFPWYSKLQGEGEGL